MNLIRRASFLCCAFLMISATAFAQDSDGDLISDADEIACGSDRFDPFDRCAGVCGQPNIDIWDTSDPANPVLHATVKAIQTAQNGQQHYNYFSASAHPIDVAVGAQRANTWIQDDTRDNDPTDGVSFGFTFGADNDRQPLNIARLNFRVFGSTSDPFVSQSDDPGEAVESPPGSDAFIGNYRYGNNTDGIDVSGIAGTEWCVIVDSVDFGSVSSWRGSNGSDLSTRSDDVSLVLGNEYRWVPACTEPCEVSVVVIPDDADDDGIPDDEDNCPNTPNPGQQDTDGDGQGDACDEDCDNDGVDNDEDNCECIANADQADSDLDGAGDVCDVCPFDPTDDGSDGDGVCDDVDNCVGTFNPDQADSDGDGNGDACDVCPGGDDNADQDGDGVADFCDNCPEDFNPGQEDNNGRDDGDGIGDACECQDADGDGYEDAACGGTDCDDGNANINPGAAEVLCDGIDNDCDASTRDDGPVDSDGDGVGDACDPCPNDPTDDASDGDGICDDVDNCIGVANPDQADRDGDGLGDACDDCPDDPDNDADGDGVCGDIDLCPDTAIPEATVPASGDLRTCHWALLDGDSIFDTNQPERSRTMSRSGNSGSDSSTSGSSSRACREPAWTLDDTLGCSCEQIIDVLAGERTSSGSGSATHHDGTRSSASASKSLTGPFRKARSYGCSDKLIERFICNFVDPGAYFCVRTSTGSH